MRVTLQKLLESLAVRRILVPYETSPWVLYDEDTQTTVSAEVRMGPDGDDLESEIQFFKDDDAGVENADDNSETGDSGTAINVPQQRFYMRARLLKEGTWSPVYAAVDHEDFTNKVAEWEEKVCSFFRACIQAVQMGQIPDIESIKKQEFPEEYGGRGGRGKIGRKSPKIKPGQLLGVKKPGA